MTSITNNAGINLVLAAWLVHDDYDYVTAPNYISATSLMKPLRHKILPARIPAEQRTRDVEEFIASSLGSSIHDSVEKAWQPGNFERNLKKLGYPNKVIERVLINPTDAELDAANDPIPVYLEQRMYRPITVDGVTFIIGGKYDGITEGIVNDTKSTSAFSWMFGGKDGDYQKQMSLYRWIDQKGYGDIHTDEDGNVHLLDPFRPRITEDYGRINFVFTDWQKVQAASNPAYPQRRVEQKEINLLEPEEVEEWIKEELRLFLKFKDKPEPEIPYCTPEELWQSDPVYKYYSNPAKTDGRATKNFDNLAEAMSFKASKGKGTVITVPGKPKRCEYCEAFEICTQKDQYL